MPGSLQKVLLSMSIFHSVFVVVVVLLIHSPRMLFGSGVPPTLIGSCIYVIGYCAHWHGNAMTCILSPLCIWPHWLIYLLVSERQLYFFAQRRTYTTLRDGDRTPWTDTLPGAPDLDIKVVQLQPTFTCLRVFSDQIQTLINTALS